MSTSIRILIADDHPIVRQGLRALVETQPDMEVVGEAADGEEAVLKARALQPDVALMDLVMPRKGGIEAIEAIKRENPGVRVLVLTSFAQDDKVMPAIRAGAQGYLLKDSPPKELLQAIREVYRDESWLDPHVARRLLRELGPRPKAYTLEQLTDRELEVLKLLAQGLSNQQIAGALVVSDRTVGKHVSNILDKLHLANRTQAVLYALRQGLAKLDSEA